MSFYKLLKITPFMVLTLLNVYALSAHAEGGVSGGGGDAATEMRIDEIRADILKWISEGGATGLKFPNGITPDEYRSQMIKVLQTHSVVIGAVTADEERSATDPELKVEVDGQPKACRGFTSERDHLPHILCKTERFKDTAPSDQYQLIHHEYAGLVGLEQNVGASSDYVLSSQLTGFLELKSVLKLAVKTAYPWVKTVKCGERECRPLDVFGAYEIAAGGQYCRKTLRIELGGGAGADEVISFSDSSMRGLGLSNYGTKPILFDTQQTEMPSETVYTIHNKQWIETKSDRVILVHQTKYSSSRLFESSSTVTDRADLIPTPQGLLQYVRYRSDNGKAYVTQDNCLYKRVTTSLD